LSESETRSEPDPNTQTILSVMKTYPTNEVAIIGCHAAKMSRKNCEYDLLVVSKDPTPMKFVRAGDSYAEIVFKNESELRDADPELAASLARAVALRDNALLLGGTIATCERRFEENCGTAAESRLASSLKALGRVDALAGQDPAEADFWLTSAAIDFAESEVYSSLVVPSPSHLFGQMKRLSKSKPTGFEEWAEASAFSLASRTSCENRLDGVAIVYDILETTELDSVMSLRLGRYRSEDAIAVVRAKAEELLSNMETIECFSFLGIEGVKTILDLYALQCHRLRMEPDYSNVLGVLASGKDRIISEEILRGLGFVRKTEMVRAGADALRSAISTLARKM